MHTSKDYVMYNGAKMPLVITSEIRDTTFRLSKVAPEKYAAIKRSIASANGKLDEPIKLMKLGSETGDYLTIVDGHTRYEILGELDKLPLGEENFTVLSDLFSVEDAIQLAYRLNDMRRQAIIYQQAVNAIKVNPTLSDREIAEVSGIGHVTISAVRYISVQSRTENKTVVETEQLSIFEADLASGVKGIEPIYQQLKKVEMADDKIDTDEDIDEEFREALKKEWEVEKYKDKNVISEDNNGNLKGHLIDEIDAWKAKKAGEVYEVTQYDKDVYPVKVKILKLRDKYSGVNAITTAGSQDAITNTLSSIRAFLLTNMTGNIVDVKIAIADILNENLEQKMNKDLGVIMKQIEEALEVSKTHDYFIATFVDPKNPKGVA
jgi:hypothetical protein